MEGKPRDRERRGNLYTLENHMVSSSAPPNNKDTRAQKYLTFIRETNISNQTMKTIPSAYYPWTECQIAVKR